MKIIGTGHAVPKLVVTNDMLAEFLDTSDKWIRTRTGIEERRLLSDETLADIAAEAMKKALEDANVKADDIDFIICSNVANNMVTPGFGCLLQGMVGANCPTIDINCACTGFVYALHLAEAYFKANDDYKNILVVAAEEPSRYCDWKERDTSVLFADGAGAAVLTRGDNMLGFHLNTKCYIEPLYYRRKLEPTPFDKTEEEDHPLIMNGREVYKIAISSSTSDITKVLEKTGISADEVDHFLLHQANIRIINTIRDFIGQPESKFHSNIHKYGNTSSATIPILLDELKRKNTFKEGDILVLSAFGGGFTTGACVYKW